MSETTSANCACATFHRISCHNHPLSNFPFSTSEPTFTKAEVEQLIEAIAVRVEDIESVLDVDYPRTLLLRSEVLEAIRSTKI